MSTIQRRIGWLAVVFALILSALSLIPGTASTRAGALPAQQPVEWMPGAIPEEAAFVPPEDSPEFVDIDGAGDFARQASTGRPEPESQPTPKSDEKSFDPATSVELIDKRSAESETWRNADGTYTRRWFTEPKFFAREGQWLPIDSTLVVDESRPEWVRTTANAWAVSFGPIEPDGSGGVEVTGATGTVRFTPVLDLGQVQRLLPEVDPLKPDTVRYRDVWPGVDVVYTVGADRVKEDIVVNSAPSRHEFTFLVSGADLQGVADLVGEPTGELDFVGALDGEFRVAPPTVLDKNGSVVDAAARPVQAATRVDGAAKALASQLSVSVDKGWLASLTEQDFPVVIDPTLYSTGVSGWRNFWTDGASGNLTEEPPAAVTHRVGAQTILGQSGRWRAMLKFNHEALFGSGVYVEDADLVLAGYNGQNQSQLVLANAASNGCLSYHCVPGDGFLGSATVGSASSPVSVDVTAYYSALIFAEDDDRWIILRTPELFSTDYKEVSANLEITYTHQPGFAVENPWPLNESFISGAAEVPETLSVDSVIDGDGDTVEYRFVVASDAGMTMMVADSGWFTPSAGPRVSWTPPAGIFQIGSDYWWRVETRDQTHPAVEPAPFRLRLMADRLGQDGFGGWFDGVNTLLGNYLARDVDLHVESVGPSLDVVRTLNTVEGATTPRWGDHFMQLFDRRAVEADVGGFADIVYGDGRTERFTKVGADIDPEWEAPAGWNDKLEGPIGGPWTLTTGDGTVVSFTATATGVGAPSSIADAFGHEIAFDRSVVDVVAVTDEASQRAVRYNLVTGTQLVASVEVDNPAGGSPLEWTYQYDSGRLWKACDPLTHCKAYEWETTNGGTARLKRVLDRNGHVDVELTYDEVGRVASVEDAYGQATSFDYEQNETTLEFQTEITDANGKVWVHRYSPDGNLISEQLPGVAPTTYTYDATTRLRTEIIDPNGNTSRLAYDDSHRVQAKENGEGEKTFYGFDPAGNEISVCDGRSADTDDNDVVDANTYCVESNFAEDGLSTEDADEMRALRLLRSRTTPTSGGQRATEEWTYTDGTEAGYGAVGTMPAGLVETYVDALGKVTHFDYFAGGDLAREWEDGPGGFVGKDTRYTYDALGRLLTRTDVSDTFPSGVTTTYTYDAVGNRLTETGPQVTNAVSTVSHRARTTSTFDANRNVSQVKVEDLVGGDKPRVTSMAYDDNDREIRVVDPEGHATERRFDAVGLVRLVRDSEGRWLRTTYDDRRLAVKTEMLGEIADPQSPTGPITVLSETQFDAAGRKVVETDAEGRVLVTEYDTADRPTRLTMPEYHDDEGGSVREVVLKHVVYDDAGLIDVVEESDETGPFPVMRSLDHTHDEGGRLIRVEGGTDGYTRRVDTTYDDSGTALSVLTTQLAPTPVSGGAASTETRFDYDVAGRLIEQTVENGSDDLVTTYAYDRRGLRTSSVPPAGNETGADPSDHRVGYEHDELGRLVTTRAPEVAAESNGGSPVVVEPEVVSGYDTYGNQTHQRDERGNVTVTSFDRLSRQARIDQPSYTPPGGSAISAFEQFGYDGVGNQTSYRSRRACTTNYEFDELNRVRFQRDPAAGTACGGGQTLVSDSFGGANGEDWNAAAWTTTTNAIGGVTDLQSGEGRMAYAGESGSMRAEATNSQHTDATLTARFKFDSTEGVWAMFFLRASNTPSGLPWAPTQGYTFAFTPAFGGTRYLKKVSGGVESVLEAEESSPIAVDTWYRVRFEVSGSTVRGKVWPDGQAEPAAWSMQGTDGSPLGAGGASIWVNTWEDIDPQIHFDDLRVTTGTVTAGASTEYQYDAVGNRTKAVDPTGAVTDYTYDARNRIRKQIDTVRAVTVTPQAGSPGPQSAETITATTHTTTFSHDDLGRQVEVQSPAGVRSRSSYDDIDAVVTSTNVGDVGNSGDDQVTEYVRDVYSSPVIERDPLGREQRYVYDQAGRRLSQGAYADSSATTPEWETRQEHDASGNIVRQWPGEAVHANSTTPPYSYDYSYDGLNRLTAVSEPISSGKSITTAFGYDEAGNRTRTLAYPTGELPSTLTESFGGSNGSAWPTSDWTSTVTTTGGVVDLQSGEGRMKYAGSSGSMRAYAAKEQHTDATLTARFKFDSIEGVWAMFFLRASNTPSPLPWAPTEGYTFGFTPAFGGTRYLKKVSGGVDSVLEAEESSPIAANTWYRVRFEVSGSTVRGKVWPDGQTEPSTWSMEATDSAPLAAGGASIWVNTWENVDHDVRFDDVVVTGGGIPAQTTTTYNSWNLEESTIEPWTAAHSTAANRTFTQVYDAGGLRTEDRLPGSVTVTSTYDALGRVASQSSGGATRSFGYDAAGRRTSMNHPWGTQTFVYDDRSLMVGAAGPGGNTIERFDGDGRALSRKDPAGTHTFTWTSLNTIDTATDPLSGAVLDYTFNEAQQRTRVDYGTAGSSPYRTYTYDDAGRLVSDTFKKADNSTQMSATYAYDWDGNVSQEVLTLPGNSAAGTYDYSYDRAGRLAEFDRTSGATNETTQYGWDDSGNRTSAVVVGGATKSWSYDERNRIVKGPDGTYTWDARGTLDKIKVGSTTVHDATFDNLGRMTQVVASAGTASYAYDALDRVAVRNGSDRFGYTGTAIDPSSASNVLYSRTPSGRLLAVKQGSGAARLAGLNRHGDLRWLYDTAGVTSDTNVMNPFGQTITRTGVTGSNVGFQGDWTDPTSGDVWMGARWYTPNDATFRSRDTYGGELRTPVTLNRYTYAASNPVRYFDPDGRCLPGIAICTPALAELFAAMTRHNMDYSKAQQDMIKWVFEHPEEMRESRSTAIRTFYGDEIDAAIAKDGLDASGCGEDYDCRKRLLEDHAMRKATSNGFPVTAHTQGNLTEHIAERRQQPVDLSQYLPETDVDRAINFYGTGGTGSVAGLDWSVYCDEGDYFQRATYKRDCAYLEGISNGLSSFMGSMEASALWGVGDFLIGDAVNCVYQGNTSLSFDASNCGKMAALAGVGQVGKGARFLDDIPGGRFLDNLDDIGEVCRRSFGAETRILMADGTTKRIADIRAGDQVLATDPETGRTGARTVVAMWPHIDQLLTLRTSAGEIVSTEDHRYWNATDGEWQESQYLDLGDRFLTADGDQVTFNGLDWTSAHTANAYDLTIADLHAYYVGAGDEWVLAHNCDAVKVLDETLHGSGNFTSAFALRSDDALDAAEVFLGPGYRESLGQAGKTGQGVFVSKQPDGTTHIFRMDPESLTGAHQPGVAHVHFEIKDSAGNLIANNHVEVVE